MNAISHYAFPILIIGWVMYRRTKRSIGFQKLAARRMKVRLGFFAFAALLLLLLAVAHPVMFIGYAAGIAGGLVLSHYAARHFLTERRADGLYYRTHIWIESTVLALFLGRIAYRIIEMAAMPEMTADTAMDPGAMAKDPLTGGILFVIISYYFAYYLFVMRRAKQLETGTTGAPNESAGPGAH
jgi:hypothetical protein